MNETGWIGEQWYKPALDMTRPANKQRWHEQQTETKYRYDFNFGPSFVNWGPSRSIKIVSLSDD